MTTSYFINLKQIECNLSQCFVEPMILFAGIFLNIIFIRILIKSSKTYKLKSRKPLRFIFITILICDLWYLVDHVNIWYFSLIKKPDLTSISGVCQFHSYFSWFFAFLNELQMLTGSVLLIQFVSETTKSAHDVYNNFLEEKITNDVIKTDKNLKSSSIIREFSNIPDENNHHISLDAIENVENDMDYLNEIEHTEGKNFKKSGFKLMINILDHVKNKKETIYYDILLKEKFVTLLNVFLCMYLLSFMLWIKVINVDSDDLEQTCKTSMILKKILSNITLRVPISKDTCHQTALAMPVRVRTQYI
jgi:hypothetical protein